MLRIRTILAAALVAASPLSIAAQPKAEGETRGDIRDFDPPRPERQAGDLPRGGGPGFERERPAPSRPSATSAASVRLDNMSRECRSNYRALDLELPDWQMDALGMPGYAPGPDYPAIRRMSPRRRREIADFADRAVLGLRDNRASEQRTREINFWTEIGRRASEGRRRR